MSGKGLEVVRVNVVVYEDDKQVEMLEVGYFHGQPYAVLIDTARAYPTEFVECGDGDGDEARAEYRDFLRSLPEARGVRGDA